MKPTNPTTGSGARFALGLVGTGVIALAAGVAAGVLSQVEGPWATAVTAVAISGAMLAGVGAGVWWWSRLDEAAREAHKWAWWWGGSAGLSVAAVILLTLMARGGSADAELSDGMMIALFCQIAGYTAAWIFWWLRRR